MMFISLTIRVCLFFLLVAHGVESNPGPPKTNRVKSTTRKPATNIDHDVGSNIPDHQISSQISTGTTPNISLDSWLRPSTTQQGASVFDPTPDEVFTHEDIDMDSNTLLIEIYKNVKLLNNKFDSLDNAVKNLEKDNKHLKKQNEELTVQVSSLTEKLNTMEGSLTASSKRHETPSDTSRSKT
jgi:hypothetical protein